MVEKADQNRAQLEKLLDEKLIHRDEELSKLTKAMNDMMDLLLSEVIKPAKEVQGEVTKGQILKALKKENFTSKGLAIKFELEQGYMIS